MFYPYIGRQSFSQYLLNTLTPSMWFRPKECECSWQYWYGKLTWVISGFCPRHDKG